MDPIMDSGKSKIAMKYGKFINSGARKGSYPKKRRNNMCYSAKSLAYVSDKARFAKSNSGNTWIQYNDDNVGFCVKAQAICPDGKIRKVRLGCSADSFWTIPARLSIWNTTITGWVFQGDDGEVHFNSEKW